MSKNIISTRINLSIISINFDTVGRLGQKLDAHDSRYLPVWANVYLRVNTMKLMHYPLNHKLCDYPSLKLSIYLFYLVDWDFYMWSYSWKIFYSYVLNLSSLWHHQIQSFAYFQNLTLVNLNYSEIGKKNFFKRLFLPFGISFGR